MTGQAGSTASLAGRGVLITRPHERAASLVEAVAQAGGKPFLFPTLEIAGPPDPAAVEAVLARVEDFDLAIFVSPTAAARGMALLASRGAPPPGLAMAAVGAGTARELQRRGAAQVIVPQAGADSESLLENPELADVRGRHVVVFRGAGGRELLGRTLTSRGAVVTHVACYERVLPRADPAPLLQAWQDDRIHAVTALSAEALRNLFALLGGGAALLRATPLFVPHARIAAAAQAAGCEAVVVTQPGDEAMVQSMLGYFTRSALQ